MSKMQRTKGARGERTAAKLIHEHTGWEVSRRCRQHDGDSDLLGVPGWSVEVKDQAKATMGDVARWWKQAVQQAGSMTVPLLIYKRQRGEWRAVWPIAVDLSVQMQAMWIDYDWTCEGSIAAWAALARDVQAGKREAA